MPKRTAATITAAALILLTLAGCAGTPEEAPSEPETVATGATDEAVESPAPLVAERDAEMTEAEAEAAYLAAVRDRLSKIRTQIPNATDAQLIDAAYRACERIEAGISSEGQSLIEGEEPTNGYYMDSDAIAIAARLTICPAES